MGRKKKENNTTFMCVCRRYHPSGKFIMIDLYDKETDESIRDDISFDRKFKFEMDIRELYSRLEQIEIGKSISVEIDGKKSIPETVFVKLFDSNSDWNAVKSLVKDLVDTCDHETAGVGFIIDFIMSMYPYLMKLKNAPDNLIKLVKEFNDSVDNALFEYFLPCNMEEHGELFEVISEAQSLFNSDDLNTIKDSDNYIKDMYFYLSIASCIYKNKDSIYQ